VDALWKGTWFKARVRAVGPAFYSVVFNGEKAFHRLPRAHVKEQGSQEWQCTIIYERWVLGGPSPPERQYRVSWTLWLDRDVRFERADWFDKEYGEPSRVWQRECGKHGDQWPMQMPSTTQLKVVERRYKQVRLK
jgi:hypothetical protein